MNTEVLVQMVTDVNFLTMVGVFIVWRMHWARIKRDFMCYYSFLTIQGKVN